MKFLIKLVALAILITVLYILSPTLGLWVGGFVLGLIGLGVIFFIALVVAVIAIQLKE